MVLSGPPGLSFRSIEAKALRHDHANGGNPVRNPARAVWLALLIPIAAAAQISAPPDPKAEAVKLQIGAYYWTGAAWQPLQRTNMAGGGTKHMGKMLVPGLTPQIVWTFRDSQAPVQVTDAKPLLCFKFTPGLANTAYAPSARDLVIARFDEKKDHRELQTSSGGNMFTFKAGLSKERTPEIELTGIDAETFLVMPKEQLQPGEYLLTATSLGVSGYDFGFHPPKKK